ncbi:MAG: aminotransferase class V-fold PLP-dependent enzyme [Actinobacteria bacterium]|nr:aminotransferase class V-fold PLP-dependent enzyme [Actinomycetota bacterium]
MPMPETGRSHDEIVSSLHDLRRNDARWQDGRTFGLVYDGGGEVHAIAEEAARMYLHENALNTVAMPSLAQIQREVDGNMAELLYGDEASGFMTSGGTESILMAVKAARERGRAERGIERGEIVVPTSAHVAFHKGGHYFGLDIVKVDVGPDSRADVEAMADAITDRTVLVVGSAPQYPHGVIDPIVELAPLAAAANANFHVDACMGGFVLPFMERLGEPVPLWDFRVPDVTTISLDVHKLGYAPKGASIILHRTKQLRRYQTYSFDDWLGGFYASPNMQGTRSGAPMAAAWAVMQRLGIEGYERLTRTTIDTARKLVAGVRAIDGLDVVGEPEAQLLAITADHEWTDRLDIFAVGDALASRGWYLDRQHRPDSLHATVSAGNAPVADDFLTDIAASVAETLGQRSVDRSTQYSTLD